MTVSNLSLRIAYERRAAAPSRRASDLESLPDADEIQRTAAENERRRIARELHDGVLNSLTGAALQVRATSQLIEQDPQAARARLQEIERMITEQQTELRTWIEGMRHGGAAYRPAHPDLLIALKALSRRSAACGPRVELTGSDFALIPQTLVDHVYRLVEETVSNGIRHARADYISIDVRIWRHDVVITVEDDGTGFPFHGRYDLASLQARRVGPASVKERVALLHGQLVLTSRRTGSRIEIRLPIQRNARRLPQGSRADGHRLDGRMLTPGLNHADSHRHRR
jgi:signal transduction histidine kinase